MNRNNRYNIDMLNGPLWKKIIIFAIPLALTNMLQLLFNSADIAVVGRFAGSIALAAVGANGAYVGVFVNFLSGFSAGPNVVLAKLIGSGRENDAKKMSGVTLWLMLVMGTVFMIVGNLVAVPALRLIDTPADVLGQAVLYLRIYMLGVPFIAVYNGGAALLRSTGDTRRPLYCLVTAGVVNLALNLFFVIVFSMGVAGVALATTLSNILCCGMVLRILSRETGVLKLTIADFRPDGSLIRRITRDGLPAGVQSMVFAISNVFLQAGINSFGPAAIAGCSAALNFEFFAYYPVFAFGQATVTFTSQNYAARKLDRCVRVFWLTMLEGFLLSVALGLIFVVFRDKFILFYTTDPDVIDFAVRRMCIVTAAEATSVIFEIPCGALRGLGHPVLPSLFTIIGTVLFRIFWVFLIFPFFGSFESLIIVYPISWYLAAVMIDLSLVIIWHKIRKSEGKPVFAAD